MLIGHLGLAFAGKQLQPRISLGTAIVASLFADVLLFAFVLTGVEHVTFRSGPQPAPYFVMRDVAYSHSIVMSIAWAAVLSLAHWTAVRDRGAAAVIALLAISHPLLDVIASPSSLPLMPGAAVYVGWTAARYLPLTMIIEAAMFGGGLVLYVAASRSTSIVGRWGFWGGVTSWTLAWYLNIAGPPHGKLDDRPLEALILLALMMGWGYWMDRNRVIIPSP